MISFLKTFFTVFTSFALHTTASKFAFVANLACCNTIRSTFLLNPISFNDLLSREVRIVTPISLVLPETRLAALRASKPELICIVK